MYAACVCYWAWMWSMTKRTALFVISFQPRTHQAHILTTATWSISYLACGAKLMFRRMDSNITIPVKTGVFLPPKLCFYDSIHTESFAFLKISTLNRREVSSRNTRSGSENNASIQNKDEESEEAFAWPIIVSRVAIGAAGECTDGHFQTKEKLHPYKMMASNTFDISSWSSFLQRANQVSFFRGHIQQWLHEFHADPLLLGHDITVRM